MLHRSEFVTTGRIVYITVFSPAKDHGQYKNGTHSVHHIHFQILNGMATHPTSLHGIRIRSGRLNESDSI